MCLNTLWSEERAKKWLRRQKSPLIVYNVARTTVTGRYIPTYWDGLYRKGWNKAHPPPNPITDYVPYFHRWYSFRVARKWKQGLSSRYVLRWRIRKRDVTAVGTQAHHIVIVCKRAYLMGEVKTKR